MRKQRKGKALPEDAAGDVPGGRAESRLRQFEAMRGLAPSRPASEPANPQRKTTAKHPASKGKR